MNDPEKEPRQVNLGQWLQQNRMPMAAVMLVVTLAGVVLGQTWLLALGSMGLWFLLYPGLAGSFGRKTSAPNTTRQAKGMQPISAPAKADPIKPEDIYQEQIQHILQMAHEIEAAAYRIDNSRVRQSCNRAIAGLPELVDSIYGLAKLARSTRRDFATAASDEVAARLRRWDAQIDHAVSLFDTLLHQTLNAAGTGARSEDFEKWPKTLERESEWLRSAAAQGPGQLLM